MDVWGIVVAAGSGSRFGGPKQYELLGQRRVLDWALDAARTCCDAIVLVVPPGREADPEPGADVVVAGGATRSASVRAGLAALPPSAVVAVVHDAARPFTSPATFRAVVDAVVAGAAGAVPGVPVVDTLTRVEDGRVAGTVERDGLVAVQTPQAFRADVLRRAHEGEPEATDDAALVEAIGGSVVLVDGDPANLKLTSPADLAVARARARATGAEEEACT